MAKSAFSLSMNVGDRAPSPRRHHPGGASGGQTTTPSSPAPLREASNLPSVVVHSLQTPMLSKVHTSTVYHHRFKGGVYLMGFFYSEHKEEVQEWVEFKLMAEAEATGYSPRIETALHSSGNTVNNNSNNPANTTSNLSAYASKSTSKKHHKEKKKTALNTTNPSVPTAITAATTTTRMRSNSNSSGDYTTEVVTGRGRSRSIGVADDLQNFVTHSSSDSSVDESSGDTPDSLRLSNPLNPSPLTVPSSTVTLTSSATTITTTATTAATPLESKPENSRRFRNRLINPFGSASPSKKKHITKASVPITLNAHSNPTSVLHFVKNKMPEGRRESISAEPVLVTMLPGSTTWLSSSDNTIAVIGDIALSFVPSVL